MKRRGVISIVALVLACAISAADARGGVVPIFVVAGQSNATGFETNAAQLSAAQQASQAKVLYAGSQGWAVNWGMLTPPTEPANTMRIFGNIAGFGPELTL